MRPFFILNPAAGRGRADKLWHRFKSSWESPPGTAVARTEARGHASELAEKALRWGFDRVIAVGGDGTLSEAAHGLLAAGRPFPEAFALGHLPVGSGCDFARHFGLRKAPEAWAALMDRGRVRRIDAGRVRWKEGGLSQERFFVNIAMAGLPGDVAHAMEASGKPWGGTASYLASALSHLLRSKAKNMRLVVDGRETPLHSYHLLAVANTATTGGGMRIAPGADPEDGRLDLIQVRGVRRARLLWHFPKIYRGTHLKVEGIDAFKVGCVEATSESRVLLNIDGEPLGRLPAVIDVLPGALPVLLQTRLLVPPQAAMPVSGRPASSCVGGGSGSR